jgi:ribosome silencing factor RsfS/YbeB/iojap
VPVKKKTATSKAKTSKVTPSSTRSGAIGAAKPGSNPKVHGRPVSADTRKTTPGAATPRKPSSAKPPQGRQSLKTVVIDALADMKALEVKVLDVRGLTDIADFMVIASGTSDRHVRSVAQRVVERTKESGFRPHGVEGQQDGDWVLIDLNEMIVHVMLPRVREFYGLEKLWDMTATKRAARA